MIKVGDYVRWVSGIAVYSARRYIVMALWSKSLKEAKLAMMLLLHFAVKINSGLLPQSMIQNMRLNL